MSTKGFPGIAAKLAPDAQYCGVERLTGGVSADVHRLDLKLPDGQHNYWVVRAHGATHSGHGATLEYDLLQALFNLGLPVPEPVLVDTSGKVLPDPFLVISFIEGSTTIELTQDNNKINLLAQALANIHKQPTQSLPPLPTRTAPLPELLDYLPQGADWSALQHFLEELEVKPYQGELRLLHGDFWPENLLWQNSQLVGILDWEDAALGDPLCDLAACRVELRYKFGREIMQAVTQAYAEHLPVDEERLALWQIYVAAAAQQFMGQWGLEPAREATMRREALASIREAGDWLMASFA